MAQAATSGGKNNAQAIQARVAYLSMEPKTGLASFLKQLDGELVTHVILAFACVDPSSGQLQLNRPEDKQYLGQVAAFKRKYPHVRVLISINNEPAEAAQQGNNTLQNNNNNHHQHSHSQSKSSTQQHSTTTTNHQHQDLPANNQNNTTSSVASNQPAQDHAGTLHHSHNNAHMAFNGAGAFNKLAQSSQMRQKFARSAMEFLKCYSLDGIDLDWEFPNFPHYFGINREYEKTGLTKIAMELRSAIVEDFFDRQVAEQHHNQHNNHNQRHHHHHHHAKSSLTSIADHLEQQQQQVQAHLLTVAIGAQENIIRSSYELKALSNLVDWFNVMSYDYYMFKAYSPFTGPNSPLKPIVDPYVPVLGKLSFETTLGRLLAEDIDRDKIVMGIPTYARAYRLLFKHSHPAPLTLAYGSRSGCYSSEYLSYQEVCEILAKPETIVDFDKRARVPYLLCDDGYTWVSYENEQSLQEKVKLIVGEQLGGYMTWNLNSDFFNYNDDDNRIQQQNDSGSDSNQQQMTSNNIDQLSFANNFPLHRALYEAAKGVVA